MLSVVVLSFANFYCNTECRMLSVVMLSVVMLSVVMLGVAILSVVAPSTQVAFGIITNIR